MVTLDKLQEHITKSKTKVTEAAKKAAGQATDPELRKEKKKFRRLTRKAGKMAYAAKMAEARKKPKKSQKAEG